MNKIKVASIVMLASTVVLIACLKKDYDVPPDLSQYDPKLEVTHNIAALKRMNGVYNPSNGGDTTLITQEIVISGIVTANDRSGNFYKQIVIQDDSGAIMLSIDANNLYTDYPIGRKVYVKCKGLWLGYDGGLPILASEPNEQMLLNLIVGNDINKHIVKANIGNEIKADTVTIQQIKDAQEKYYNKLVYIKEAQFKDTNYNYAQPNATTNREIQDCNKTTFVVRSSNYSSFATTALPKGKGTIAGIYNVYISASGFKTPQLIIRDTNDVKMNNTRCNGSSSPIQYLLNETFENLNQWNTQNVTGAQVWGIAANYGQPKPSAAINGYVSGAKENEDWLISKELDLTGKTSITLSFMSACDFNGNPLECYISTNYSGTGLPSTAIWEKVPALFATDQDFKWTNSGNIDISSYKGQIIYIAFKYTSTTSAAASWEIDNVKVEVE